MGKVYRAEQTTLSRTVAVKILHPHLAGDKATAARFITEARAASRLNHPNSVAIIDFGSHAGQLYIVMEYLRGRDLARMISEDGLLSLGRTIDIVLQVLSAIGEAHHLDIIHRDLKPENIIVEPLRSGGDFVKVVDFGLAKIMVQTASKVTTPGLICGTPDYMAPEQGRGDNVDARSDLYAVGVLLFALLTGKLPFESESPTQVVLMHISSDRPNPAHIAPLRRIPVALAELTMKAMHKEPSHRYQTAEQFSAALRDAKATLGAAEGRASFQPALEGLPLSGARAVACGACGAMVARDQRFCSECGSRISLVPRQHATPEAPLSVSVSFPLPLFNRQEDLDWLDASRFELAGSLHSVRIVGPPGIGKSRLLETFATRLPPTDLLFWLRPDPWQACPPLYTAARLLAHLLREPVDAIDPFRLPTAVRPGAIFVFSRKPIDPPADPQTITSAVAETLRWALNEAHRTGGQPITLIADDLEHIDPPSLAALTLLVRDRPPVPVFLIGAHTDRFDPGWQDDHRSIRGLALSSFTDHIGGARLSLPPAQKETLLAPLYLEHLVRFGNEGGTDPPLRLGDLLALRIDRLGVHERQLLQSIAALGDDTPLRDAEQLAAGSGDLSSLARLLSQKGLLVASTGGLSVSHPLVRDIALSAMPQAVRRALHAHIFAVSSDGNFSRALPTEAIALHATEGDLAFEAFMLLEKAAQRAKNLGDHGSHVLWLRRALQLAREELAKGEADDPERAVVIFSRKLALSLLDTKAYLEADGILHEALNLVGPADPARAELLLSLAQVAVGRGNPSLAKHHLEECLGVPHSPTPAFSEQVRALMQQLS